MPKTRAEYKYTEAIQTMASLLWKCLWCFSIILEVYKIFKNK